MRIGIDTGGTFTDFVIYDPESGSVQTFKLLTTPVNPANAILAGLEQIEKKSHRQIIHGSTVATNALLEGKGAKAALVTTAGFEDVLFIRRQSRPALYDLFADPPPALIPDELRLGVRERVMADGAIQISLSEEEIAQMLQKLKNADIEAVAVCTLFSFLAPVHENKIGKALKSAGYFVSLSSEILPEFREYERTSTTVVNAVVSPVMDRYLSTLEDQLGEDDLQVMQSNGGSISPGQAKNQAVRCILSGPAGGVVGAQMVGQQAGFDKLITFDMGGTSTDVSLVDGSYKLTGEGEIGGYPIRIPVIDIHTVGAGGGSIAEIDAGGALQVGPESAGADPGPACYGKGTIPTVTDANLVLGRLMPEHFLGGEMPLDIARAQAALENLGTKIRLSAEKAALGIVQIANAHMARALRVISVARGYDPIDFTLLSFGGAGGLHAVELARDLGVRKVLVPPQAATLSALGMLMADVIKDYSQTVMLSGSTSIEDLETNFREMEDRGQADLIAEGVPKEEIMIEKIMEMRYQGQSYELPIYVDPDFLPHFHLAHQDQYGYSNQEAAVEIVTLRVRAVGRVPSPALPKYPLGESDPKSAWMDSRPVLFENGKHKTKFYSGNSLSPGNQIKGPAIVLRSDTTILIPPTDSATVDKFLNLIIEVADYGD